jgi:hypothetical protein
MAEQPKCEVRGRPVLRGVNEDKRQVVFFRPRCKSWNCPACGPINRALWAWKGFYAAQALFAEGRPVMFTTITCHEGLTPGQSLWVWPRAWAKLSTRARRATQGAFTYLMIPEQHRSTKLHVHAIDTSGLKESWWKDNARESGLGYMIDHQPARSPGGVALYISKELTKSLGTLTWPKGFRRVRTSRDWPKAPETERPAGWEFTPLPLSEDLQTATEEYEAKGYTVRLLDHSEAWSLIGVMEFADGDGVVCDTLDVGVSNGNGL